MQTKKRFFRIVLATLLAIILAAAVLAAYLIWLGHVTRTAYLQSLERSKQIQTP